MSHARGANSNSLRHRGDPCSGRSARAVCRGRTGAARLRAGQRMPLLSDAQYDRLNELAWVMYVTEDGEEYFGKVGSDFTQWDPPDELTEDDIELLRLSMTELDEDDAAMTSNMEGGAFDGDCGGEDQEVGADREGVEEVEQEGGGEGEQETGTTKVGDTAHASADDEPAAEVEGGVGQSVTNETADADPASSQRSRKARFMSSASRATICFSQQCGC